MKKLVRTTLLLLAVTVVFAGCKKTIEGELGSPKDKVKGMNGTWVLSGFYQIDLNNPIKEERELTRFYVQEGQDNFELTFNSSDRSYSVEHTLGKNFFGESGTWGFDDEGFPSFLYMDDGSQELEFLMGNVVGEFDNTLSIELNRLCDDGVEVKETVIYRFEFTRK